MNQTPLTGSVSSTVEKVNNVKANSADIVCSFSTVPKGANCVVFVSRKGSDIGLTYSGTPGISSQTIKVTGLPVNTTFVASTYITYNGRVYDGEHCIEFTTKDEERICPDSNHPHWIDLGLPSGTKWRCCNVGASTPGAIGGYYEFGKVTSAPSSDQIMELVDNTKSEKAFLVNGGFKFTGKNGGTIFIPYAGYKFDYGYEEGFYNNFFGNYWSSTSSDTNEAFILLFAYDGYPECTVIDPRNILIPVRPVR